VSLTIAALLALVAPGCGGSSSSSASASASASESTAGKLPLRVVANVPLPGGSSRFDYQSLDTGRNRLYLSHLAAGEVLVFDVAHRRVSGTIAGLPGVHGVVVAPRIGRVYAAATDRRELVTIDERSGHIVRGIPAGVYPDGIAYDPADGKVFVSDESGSAVIVADALSGRARGAIEVGGGTGNVQYDPTSGHVLVNVQTSNELVEIDPRRQRVLARYGLPGCESSHGLHLDPARRLAFIACEGNARLLVFDLKTKRITQSFTVGDDPDVLDFDPGLRRLYVAAESGQVAVFAENGRGLRKLAQAFLADHAHSVAVDPRTHLVYFPLEDVDGRPVMRILRPTGH
jgi:DNA-binding beta-propeller fold protein YncE